MGKIELTPETLLAQSTELASIQAEFESLFSQVTSSLNRMNESWSEGLASNFSGKITAVQKSFSSVAEMLGNGVSAARIGANTFAEPGLVLTMLCGGTSFEKGSDLLNWIAGQGGELQSSDLILGELSKITGLDLDSAKEALGLIAQGDYEGAIERAGEKLIDWTASALAGEIPADSWVSTMQDLTGGRWGFDGLEKAFYKNLMGNTAKNVVNIAENLISGDADNGYIAKQLGELVWNAGPGAVIETGADAAFHVVEKIPVLGDYYRERGVSDGEGAIGAMIEDITYAVTGDAEIAAADGNYYQEHGGIAGGIVNGVVEIGGYVGEKIGTLWHSAFGR